jgi:ubiquitin-protein ligase
MTPINETFYYGETYAFTLDFPHNYPISELKVLLKNKIFHLSVT